MIRKFFHWFGFYKWTKWSEIYKVGIPNKKGERVGYYDRQRKTCEICNMIEDRIV